MNSSCESRMERIYREIEEFLENDSQNLMSMTVYKSEFKKTKNLIKEKNLQIEIVKERNVSNEKIFFTLKKM